MVEFISEGRYPALSSLTEPPTRESVNAAGTDIVLMGGSRPPLVLVHGFAPQGNQDRRLVAAATLLARTGFAVAVPTIPGLARGRLREDDVEPVITALALRPDPTTLVAVSVGSGPALLAAADPRVSGRVSSIVVLGGFASAHELVRYFLTGDYEYGSRRGHVRHDPDVVRAFVAANADLIDTTLQRGLEAGDRQAAESVGRVLFPLLVTLSPERVMPRIHSRVLLVHGRGDLAVPYTETLRLAAARPHNTTVVLVGVIGHIEGTSSPWRGLRDLIALMAITYAMIAAH